MLQVWRVRPSGSSVAAEQPEAHGVPGGTQSEEHCCMNISQRPDSFEPGDYLEVLRRRWWIVLVLAIVGLLVAAAYVKEAPKVYTATATVQVTANAANTNSVAAARTSGGSIDNPPMRK